MSHGRKTQCGFTLMELIGVMAVLAIMAGMIAPSIVDSIKRAYGDAETGNVASLGSSLLEYIKDNKHIPSSQNNDWITAIAAYSDLPKDKVEFNARGFKRRLYVDPQFFSGPNKPFTGYQQTSGLSEPPLSPRIMLISDLTADVPALPNNNNKFSDIWEQAKKADIIEGENIKIYRMQLISLFHRVVLSNEDKKQVGYSLESGNQMAIPAKTGKDHGMLTIYAMHNSMLNLYDQPYPNGKLQFISVINEEKNFHFDKEWEI